MLRLLIPAYRGSQTPDEQWMCEIKIPSPLYAARSCQIQVLFFSSTNTRCREGRHAVGRILSTVISFVSKLLNMDFHSFSVLKLNVKFISFEIRMFPYQSSVFRSWSSGLFW